MLYNTWNISITMWKKTWTLRGLTISHSIAAKANLRNDATKKTVCILEDLALSHCLTRSQKQQDQSCANQSTFYIWFWPWACNTLFNHVGWFHDPRICQLIIFHGHPKHSFTVHTFILTLKHLGGILLPALCIRIIVYSCIIHMKHYSS